MKLALQLACYNGARYLPFLFASLQAQTHRDWRLYVLDNASDPENTRDIIQAVARAGFSIVLKRVDQNIGFAGAHNYLFEFHRHESEAVQLLNDDAFLEPEYLAEALACLKKFPICGAVSGNILRWDFEARDQVDRGRTKIIDSLGLQVDIWGKVTDKDRRKIWSEKIDQTPQPVWGVSGCLPMYRVTALKQVSFDNALFDTKYHIYKEDVDLAFRLRAGGYTAMVIPARAYHRRSLGNSLWSVASLGRQVNENAYFSYRNHLWTWLVHMTWFSLITRRLGWLFFESAKALYWLVRAPRFVLGVIRDTIQARSHLWAKRRFIRRLRLGKRSDMHGMQTSKADIAIIMVSHNDLSEACLLSLKEACSRSRLKIQLVVVDNRSTAYRANEFVERFLPEAWVLLRDQDYGFGHSCNRGAKQVAADYYFFLNPDTVLPDPGLLDSLYAYAQTQADIGVLSPKIIYPDGRLQETCRRFPKWYMPFVQRTALVKTGFGERYAAHFSMRDYDHASPREVDWAQGSALFVPSAVWQAVQGFDERYFMYFEDIDLCRRVRALGKKVVYYPEATLQHAHGKESARIPGLIRNLLQNEMARAHLTSWLKYLWKWRWSS